MDQVEISKLFDTAISREVEAHNFYKAVADRVEDQGVKEIFAQLAREETGHEETLWRFKGDPTAAVTFKPPKDFKVTDTVETPPLTVDMKPADAIALAMKKEQEAMEFYKQLADWTEDERLKKIYQNLSNMEMGHKAKLENLFVDIGYPEVW